MHTDDMNAVCVCVCVCVCVSANDLWNILLSVLYKKERGGVSFSVWGAYELSRPPLNTVGVCCFAGDTALRSPS